MQKKFLRVRLASDDEEGEEVGGSQGAGGEESQDTQQTKEMEEVKIGTNIQNGRFSFIGLCACNLGIGNVRRGFLIHKCLHCCVALH